MGSAQPSRGHRRSPDPEGPQELQWSPALLAAPQPQAQQPRAVPAPCGPVASVPRTQARRRALALPSGPRCAGRNFAPPRAPASSASLARPLALSWGSPLGGAARSPCGWEDVAGQGGAVQRRMLGGHPLCRSFSTPWGSEPRQIPSWAPKSCSRGFERRLCSVIAQLPSP